MFYYSTLPTKLSICVCLKLNLKVCLLLLLCWCCCVAVAAVKLLLLVLLSSYCHAHKNQATVAWHGREAKCQVILPACMSKMSRRSCAKVASLSLPPTLSITVSLQVLAGVKCLISRLLGCCCCSC